MPNILEFPPVGGAPAIMVTLNGDQWLAVMLKLAGRGHDKKHADAAEAEILAQVSKVQNWRG